MFGSAEILKLEGPQSEVSGVRILATALHTT